MIYYKELLLNKGLDLTDIRNIVEEEIPEELLNGYGDDIFEQAYNYIKENKPDTITSLNTEENYEGVVPKSTQESGIKPFGS